MKKTSKIISTLSALSMLASMCVMPAAHAEDGYTFDRSGANFVAGTDFENHTSTADQAWAFMSGATTKNDAGELVLEMSQTQAHSGSWSMHSKETVKGSISILAHSDSWAYWNGNLSSRALEVGKTYKYSYWVYADEAATTTTPNLLIPVPESTNEYGSVWLINSDDTQYKSKERNKWHCFEYVFTAEKTGLPFFYNIPAKLYIDDIKLEEVVAPQMTATTLPAEGANAPLGYNNFSMTFDKEIAEATVKLGGSTVTSTLSEDKKTVEFGLKLTSAGDKALEVTVKDTDGVSTMVSRTITVPNTLVAYADFDSTESGITPWHYFGEGQGQLSFTTDNYYSPSKAVKFDSSKMENYLFLNMSNGRTVVNKSIEKDKTYKMSFRAMRTDSTKTPRIQPLYNNTLLGGISITSDTMTKYEVVFTANGSNQRPGFYQGASGGDVIMDDVLVEEVTAPQMTATTLPAEGKNAPLGYNRFSMTFDKKISEATVKLGTSSVTSTISEDKKTVEFGLKLTTAGDKALEVTVKDTDGVSTTVSRTITVPNTLVAYADFDSTESGIITWHYFGEGQGQLSFTTDNYYSPSKAVKFDSSKIETYLLLNMSNGRTIVNKSVEDGKTYKMSFRAMRTDSTKTPQVKPLYNNDVKGYINITSDTMEKYEVVFTANGSNQRPGFYQGASGGDVIMDDVLVEEIPTANVVSTTLPGEGTNVALGYNEYTMTFDKEITSANVTYNGKTTGADVKDDGKTISFGIAAVKNGNVTITITDADNATSTVTRAITVPETLVFYTGFDNGKTAGYYVSNNGWDTPLEMSTYRSPGAALRILTTVKYGESIDVVSNRLDGSDYSQIDEGTAVFEKGKWYKVSFYGKTGGAVGTRPQIGVARRNESGNGFGVSMFTMTDEMTKYEVTFKAISNNKPFLYREEMNDEIIIDDLLVEQVEAPVDYTYDLSEKTVKANAAITATLSNEKLDAMNGVALVALYKDGVMQTCSMTTVTNLAKGEKITTNAVTVPSDINDGEYTVKAFLWDNATTSMAPICNALQISESVAAQ